MKNIVSIVACMMLTTVVCASEQAVVTPRYETVDLIAKIARRDIEGMLSLLMQGQNPNAQFGQNLETPLMLAIRQLMLEGTHQAEYLRDGVDDLAKAIKYGVIFLVLSNTSGRLKEYTNIIDTLMIIPVAGIAWNLWAALLHLGLAYETLTQRDLMRLISLLINHQETDVLITNKKGQTALDIVQGVFADEAKGVFKHGPHLMSHLRTLETMLIKKMELQHQTMQEKTPQDENNLYKEPIIS